MYWRRPWQANMNVQPVFNQYKTHAYTCSCFSKSEDKCSFAMEQATQKAFDAKLDQFNTMKNILKAYTSNRECSNQETVYHILPEQHLWRVLPALQLVNTNLPEECSKIRAITLRSRINAPTPLSCLLFPKKFLTHFLTSIIRTLSFTNLLYFLRKTIFSLRDSKF